MSRIEKQQAKLALSQIGGRQTQARLEILTLLMCSSRPLSHQEIEQSLVPILQVDRVTVYRVLEWLIEKNLAHKVASDDRVSRFASSKSHQEHHHAHFHCEKCQQVWCLEQTSPSMQIGLPEGFSQTRFNLIVQGKCAKCSEG